MNLIARIRLHFGWLGKTPVFKGQRKYYTEFRGRNKKDWQHKLPWSPCTSTDTLFTPDKIYNLEEGGVELQLAPAENYIIGECANHLHFEGALLTTVNHLIKGRTWLYGSFVAKMQLPLEEDAVGAFWWLTKTRLKGGAESILPEVDVVESSTPGDRGRFRVSLHDGTTYDTPDKKSWGFGYKPLTGIHDHWMVWDKGKLRIGVDGILLTTFRGSKVPSYFMYPIFWLAAGKWAKDKKTEAVMYVKEFQVFQTEKQLAQAEQSLKELNNG